MSATLRRLAVWREERVQGLAKVKRRHRGGVTAARTATQLATAALLRAELKARRAAAGAAPQPTLFGA